MAEFTDEQKEQLVEAERQTFFVGDIVETVDYTALLPLGIQTTILNVRNEGFYESENDDGFSYEVTFIDEEDKSWTLTYPSSYFKLIKRA